MPKPEHLVVTAFDSHYFRQGLNLIASLHRTSLNDVERILVYSLGLTNAQRNRLDLLERVEVVDFPQETQTYYPEYLHPKSHAFKCAAIKFAADYTAEGGLVLWMDAGIVALQSVEEIFKHIARDEIFFVDHSGSGFWPFYNLMFTHPRSLTRMQATNREMMGLHLCSCILGYTKSGAYQSLIDEAYVYSQDSEVVLWPKHRGAADEEVPDLNFRQRTHKKAILTIPILAEKASYETLRTLFGYYGHNGDQPIYSVLCARYECSLHPAARYNRSNRLSERASKLNWHSGAESEQLLRSRHNMENVNDDVVIYHHRGTYDNLDGLRFKYRQTDTLLLLGAQFSGSTSLISPIDTMSTALTPDDLNAQGWMPTYYSWLRPPDSEEQAASIYALVRQGAKQDIALFFLHPALLQTYPDLADEPRVFFPHYCTAALSLLDHPPASAAVLAVQCALLLGYRDIVLEGLESSEAAWMALRNRLTTFPARVQQVEGDGSALPFPAIALSDLSVRSPRLPDPEETAYWRAEVREGFPLSPLYPRRAHAHIDETELVLHLIADTASSSPVLVDVGASRGTSIAPYVEQGWRIIAFEPDPANRAILDRRYGNHPAVTIDARAVSDTPGEAVPLYRSPQSFGASSLLAFTVEHEKADAVPVTTLTQALDQHGVTHVDVLKIDTEGHDLLVLKGFPWSSLHPSVILCEFEDRKTRLLDYDFHDLAGFLQKRGFTVFVSEWHPITTYGMRHDWHGLKRYPCVLSEPEAWGNLIAFAAPRDTQTLRDVVRSMINTPVPVSFPADMRKKVRRQIRRWLR